MMKKLSVVSIARDMMKEWLTILLITVSTGLLFSVWMTMTYHPVYYTNATVAVTARGDNTSVYQNLATAQSMASDLANIFDSNVLRKRVMEELELNSLNASVSIKQIEETNLIEIGVTSGDCLNSFRVLKSMMKNYRSVSDYVIGDVILQTIEAPTVPLAPRNRLDTSSSLRRGMLLGFAFSVVLIGFFSFKRDTIKKESQLSEKVDAKVLGTIYHERKAGSILPRKKKEEESISMLIDNPLRSFWYVEANRMTASRVRSRMERRKAKVVMITSVAENEGKSTVVSNLALSLAREVNKVLLIDCDFRKPALLKVFELEKDQTHDLPAALRQESGFDQLLTRYGNTNLYLAANNTADDSEDLLESGGLAKLIDYYRDEMDYIILDSAPMALVSDTEDLANKVDASILVVREDVVLASSINDAVDTLNATRGKVLGCIYNNAYRQMNGITGYHGYQNYGGYYGQNAK